MTNGREMGGAVSPYPGLRLRPERWSVATDEELRDRGYEPLTTSYALDDVGGVGARFAQRVIEDMERGGADYAVQSTGHRCVQIWRVMPVQALGSMDFAGRVGVGTVTGRRASRKGGEV